MVTMEILEETTIALSNGTIADSLRPPKLYTPQALLRDAWWQLTNMIEDIDKISFSYEQCCLLTNYFGPCLYDDFNQQASGCWVVGGEQSVWHGWPDLHE